MKQVIKIKNLENLSYFNSNTISQYVDVKSSSLFADINRWLKSGILIQLKKGLYVTSNFYERSADKNIYMEFLANKLKEPSYLSLEYVLQKYSILTESVYSITSITLKTGRVYNNKLGLFIYRNIKEELFTGFNIFESNGFIIKEATKSKALFDWFYLKLLRIKEVNLELLKSFRLNLDSFKENDYREFKKYCKIAGIKKYLNLPELIKNI
jgi:hypothetical protein